MDIITLLLTLLVIVTTLIWIQYYWNTYRKLAKLPQEKGHILFGNLELFTGKLFAKHSTPLYQRVWNGLNELNEKARNESVFLFWVTFAPYVLLSKAKSVEQLLTNSKLIEKSYDYEFLKPWLSTGLLTSGSDKWRSRRKFLTPSFHFRILNDFIPIMNKHSKVLVKKFKERIDQPLNIVEYVQLDTLDVICETAMGVSLDAQGDNESTYARTVIWVSDAIFSRIFQISSWIDFIYYRTENGRKFKKSLDYLHQFTDKVIESRKKAMIEAGEGKNKDEEKKEDDSLYFGKKKKAIAFMDLLIKRHLEGLKPDGTSDFTPEDIREEVDTFMFEGFDTTSAGLTWTLHLLGHNEDIQDKAYEEIYGIFGEDTEREITDTDLRDLKYVELCIKEALRLYPPAPAIGRKVTEDIDIDGHTIPKGASILVYIYGLNKDPEVFPEPEKFIPERFLPEECLKRHPFAYIPFSAGPRNCIGQKFAMNELKITITEILRNFKVKSLNKNIPISVDIVLKAKDDVLVSFSPRF